MGGFIDDNVGFDLQGDVANVEPLLQGLANVREDVLVVVCSVCGLIHHHVGAESYEARG